MSKKNKARQYWPGIARVRETEPNRYVVVDDGSFLNAEMEYSDKMLRLAHDAIEQEYGQRKNGKPWIEIVTDTTS